MTQHGVVINFDRETYVHYTSSPPYNNYIKTVDLYL